MRGRPDSADLLGGWRVEIGGTRCPLNWFLSSNRTIRLESMEKVYNRRPIGTETAKLSGSSAIILPLPLHMVA